MKLTAFLIGIVMVNMSAAAQVAPVGERVYILPNKPSKPNIIKQKSEGNEYLDHSIIKDPIIGLEPVKKQKVKKPVKKMLKPKTNFNSIVVSTSKIKGRVLNPSVKFTERSLPINRSYAPVSIQMERRLKNGIKDYQAGN